MARATHLHPDARLPISVRMKVSFDSLAPAPEAAPRRRRIPAWSVPAAIAVGFACLFFALFGDRLLPAPAVDVATVLATVGEAEAADDNAARAGEPMAFQASGWVEPDPLPVKATSLVDGVIDRVHVLEGQAVKTGDPLATLIDEDHRLALAGAEREHERLLAAQEAQRAAIETAHRRVAGAKARLAAAEAVAREADDRRKRFASLRGGSVSELEVVAANSGHERALAEQSAVRAAIDEAEADVARLEAELETLRASAKVAAVEVDAAKLALARTRIVSPIDGRVLRLLAAPGQKKMLGMDDPDSATVAVLYQPERLQARVDVPLADAAGLHVGQRARIVCSLLPERVFHGEVTRITGEADLQRNTLQAKVRIESPSEQLRPEMLCRVEFLPAASGPAGETTTSIVLVTWIPRAALRGDHVWVLDPGSLRVSRRNVTPGNESKDGHIRIDEGLRPGERVVVSPQDLRENQRVQATET